MHIFIDESGIFSVTPNSPTWSTVGGVVIPDIFLEKVGKSLEKLKIAHGIEINEEFKRVRPDCTSEAYQEFLKALNDYGCTLHALSTRNSASAIDVKNLELHKSATAAAVKKYASIETDIEQHTEKIAALIESLSQQEYNQCILQSQMMCDMIPKIISYYATFLPDEIGRFKWVIDRKNILENRYEQCFKELYSGLIMIRSTRQTSVILKNRNYSAFNHAFSPNINKDELLESTKKLTGIDHKNFKNSIIPVSFGTLLKKEFSLEDSRLNIGLQVADLLISSVNRCLKQNYTNNKKMAIALGRLMINAPRIDEWSLMVMGHGHQRPIANAPAKLIKMMDSSSKKLYSEEFREYVSKTAPRQ